MKTKNRLVHLFAWLMALCGGFVLCRYILFPMHGMREWPVVLFIAGTAVIIAAFLVKARYVPAAASVAYTPAFLIGVLFQTDGVDPGGGRTNNLWIIWTVVFIGIIIISVVLELVLKKKR